MIINREYLIDEIIQFRDIMCSRKYTLEQKDDAFKGLVYAVLHQDTMTAKDQDNMIISFQAISLEWERRRLYEVFHL